MLVAWVPFLPKIYLLPVRVVRAAKQRVTREQTGMNGGGEGGRRHDANQAVMPLLAHVQQSDSGGKGCTAGSPVLAVLQPVKGLGHEARQEAELARLDWGQTGRWRSQ